MQQTTNHQVIVPQRVPTESPSIQSPAKPIEKIMSGPGQQMGASVDSLKMRIKSEFGVMFGTDTDFVISKTYSSIAQGWRFRMERNKNSIKTSFIPISKKGGLLRPGLLLSNGRNNTEMVIINQLTGKAAFTMNENPKLKVWNIYNNEAGNAPLGSVKVTHQKDIISFIFTLNGSEVCSISIKAPVRKSGICSSPKPASLYGIQLSGKFSSGLQFEENPNGEACMNDLEINAIYADKMPEFLEFVGMICLLQAMAVELY